MKIKDITVTVFLRKGSEGLEQLLHVTLDNQGEPGRVTILAHVRNATFGFSVENVETGESTCDVFIPELQEPSEIVVELRQGSVVCDRKQTSIAPPRHWVVHVVQLSHHDVGYTNLASEVLREHNLWLDQVIDMAEATRDFPEDARFRIVAEQAWSIDRYLRHAPAERVARMVELMRAGDVEVTAMFGNLTTELCGHETMVRSLYHAFRLKRRYGLDVVSAEHDDVPGFSIGLGQALAGAGVRFFCPGLPLYYSWGGEKLPSFWDEEEIFGYRGMPGAFWWQAPDGKRILFWCNNRGCGGGCHPAMPELGGRLAQLQMNGYPYSVIRWPVIGGARDNSPYIKGYADTIREWNVKWAFPRLICSTNSRFYNDFVPVIPGDLSVFSGEVPGQDYPSGASSTAKATAVNRNNHAGLPAAEALATVASLATDYEYQADFLFRAYEEQLWHDEHSWGHHFPCGPTAETSELEKAVHAQRSAALTHDVLNKAMARIADHVRLEGDGIHLVIFNACLDERSDVVSVPLREIDNCGSVMGRIEAGGSGRHTEGALRGYLLKDRWHVSSPVDVVSGKFDLFDASTKEPVQFQIMEIDSALGPVPFAAQRLGIGSGGRRYGRFEEPVGLKRDLRFVAESVPPMGYRTYRIAPRPDRPAFTGKVSHRGTTIENEYYRITVNPETGLITGIFDKEAGCELVDDSAPHGFGEIVVRKPGHKESLSSCVAVEPACPGPLTTSIRMKRAAMAHPEIECVVALHAGIKRVEFAVRVLKDPTPLLDVHLAFPFRVPAGRFRYQSALGAVDPVTDFLPGAFSNRIAVQNWVKVTDGGKSVLWSSLDAPVVSLGQLWQDRVSPAHSCVVYSDLKMPPQTVGELRGGHLYSCLFANNFGTNFAVSQSGDALFRYVFTTRASDIDDTDASGFGAGVAQPMTGILTKHPGPRNLPPSHGFMEIDNHAVRMLAFKRAEDGKGLILRLWNIGADPVRTTVRLPIVRITGVAMTNLVEEDTGEEVRHDEHELVLEMPARAVVTLRVLCASAMACSS